MLLEEKNAMWRPYRQVLAKLCWLGIIGEDEKNYDKAVENLEDTMAKNRRSIE